MNVRGAGPEDAQTYADWLQSTPSNLYDPAVYKYPTTTTLAVEHKDSVVLLNSFHGVLVMEAIAHKPGLSPLRKAAALNHLFNKIKEVAATLGIKEIWFGCKDASLDEFLMDEDHAYGFEKLKYPVYRFKL
jgi:hypothetical protein